MIIELVVGASVVALGALALRRAKRTSEAARPALGKGQSRDEDDEIEAALLAAKKAAKADGRSDGDDADEKTDKKEEKKSKKKKGKKKKKKGDDADAETAEPRARAAKPRGLRVSDVLLYADTELWLAGEIHLDEEGFALSLFVAPGGVRASHVAQLDAPGKDIAFLSPTDDVPDGTVPAELPIDGVRLSLRKRGHADVRTEGEHLPLVSPRAEYVILGGPGGRTLVVVDFDAGDRIALAGERLGPEMYDLLPGGD